MTAVQVHGAGNLFPRAAFGRIQIGNRLGVAGGVVMVLVREMPDVRGAGLLLMPAIRRHGRPTELERQEGKKDDDEKATHGRQSSG